MEIDPEEKFLKEFTKIQNIETSINTIQSNIKSLKSNTKQLSDKIDLLQLQDFQSQINRLNERMDKIESNLSETKTYLAINDINDMLTMLDSWIEKNLLNQNPALYNRTRDFLIAESASAKQAVKQLDPLMVSTKFNERCIEYFKSHNIPLFID